MEYDRINKVQSGIISPSKLRLKLIGSPNKRKDGSKNNSARTSPTKFDEVDFVKNGLLSYVNGGDFVEEGSAEDVKGDSSVHTKPSNSESSSVKYGVSHSCESTGSYSRQNDTLPKEFRDVDHGKIHQLSRSSGGNNLSTVHPVRSHEEDNFDYDSNASSSSFEFHNNGQQRSNQNQALRTCSRPLPFKWNDAEKWIVNRQNGLHKHPKRNTVSESQVNRQTLAHSVRTAPQPSNLNSITTNLCSTNLQRGSEKFSFAPSEVSPISDAASKDLNEVDHNTTPRHTTDVPFPNVRSVSMRDMGTEMTPVASQEPSRTATPVGATTPIRSPTASMPSTPRLGAPSSTPADILTDDETFVDKKRNDKKLSEQDLHVKTRKEIVALGVQLGKMNIAAWASKDQKENSASPKETLAEEQCENIEFANRAAAWEEAEKSKHAARYRREEIRIQAWESRRKAKIEAELRKIEAEAEKIRANAQEKLRKRTSVTKEQAKQKRADAEAEKNQQAAKTSAEAEYIRQTGRIPPSRLSCCNWFL